jgi:hypothetical protein
VIQTAFQIGAFQFTAFQEGRAVGAGGVRRFVLANAIARARRPRQESPTPEEVAEILVQAQARTRMLLRPVPYVSTDLRPLIAALQRDQDERELAEFRAMVEAFVDWDEAA